MMTTLLTLFVAVPLLTGGILITLPHRVRLHQVTLLVSLAGLTGFAVAVVAATSGGAVLAHGVADWPFGISIPFVADAFSALMLTVTGLLALVCSWFALLTQVGRSKFLAPMVLVLVAGVNGALLTGDLFNLFVFIEVMLLPSYALFVLAAPGRGGLRQISGARLYVTVNLLTSTVLLAAVALIYGVAGTVTMAELAGLAAENGTVAIGATVALLALSIKAAVVPVHGWLARAYPATPPAINALFSGLHTKVAIYAIYRIYAVLFDGDERYLWVGVVAFTLTMVIGVMGAVGETRGRTVLAFHMVSQIGYILMGVALFGPLGLTAGIFYLLHHMIVKASLFLSVGAVEATYGTDRLGKVGGVARRDPVLAVAFFIAALSLAGLPPFSGFVAKYSLILASIDAGQVAAAVAMVVVSLVTLLSMLKIWSGMFWGKADDDGPARVGPAPAAEGPEPATAAGGTATKTRSAVIGRVGLRLTLPALALAAVTSALGVGGEALLSLAEVAAGNLSDTSAYVEAVRNS
ncbi:monovalent cation/H+ antiporter subunit D family protein [Sanguibacter sp. Z1732]|uniref:monovalent cation/H+ antiporter subunit D family protein n=2 Tax=Micrococcales TaxID=85006 RepID=UPI003D9C886F